MFLERKEYPGEKKNKCLMEEYMSMEMGHFGIGGVLVEKKNKCLLQVCMEGHIERWVLEQGSSSHAWIPSQRFTSERHCFNRKT